MKGTLVHAGMPGVISPDGKSVLPGYRIHRYYLAKDDRPDTIQDKKGRLVTATMDCLADGMVTSEFKGYFWDHSH